MRSYWSVQNQGVPVNGAYAQQLTALMWAAGQGHAEAVQVLLARGARTDLLDDRGLTAAAIARQAGHAEVAALVERP